MHNIDNDVFFTAVQLDSSFASRVPVLIGTNDSEAGWLVPTISRLPNVAPVDVVCEYIKGLQGLTRLTRPTRLYSF